MLSFTNGAGHLERPVQSLEACQTIFVSGGDCRGEGCDPTNRPRSMTNSLP